MSREIVSGIRERAAERFGGTPEVQEWEIALLHRMHEAPEGACCRVIWTQGDPARMDGIVEGFRMAVVPRVDDLPGFCSMSVLVDREGGRCVVASTYENRTSMERATDQAMAMREQFTRQMGMEVLEVEPFELVLAHLRVPETV